MELDLQNPLTSYEDDWQYDGVPFLFANESEHMPSLLSFQSSDFRFAVRRSAISLISNTKFSCSLDPFLVYLSINYVDRFLSKHEILERRPWIMHILVVASLSLAAKMRNFDLSAVLSDLQRDGFQFDAQSIHRMETILLATLQWRMRSITPFSFLQFFISLLKIKESSLTQGLKNRASNIIFDFQHVLELLEYKPSIIAASAILCATHDLTPMAFSSFKTTISSCEYVDNDKLLECLGLMQEVIREGYEPSPHATTSCTSTPISVLDHERTSSNSRVAANNSGLPERDNLKRRRLSGLCDNMTLQISQFHQC